ncbi:phosphotransferase [Actinoplanes sp. DH11]|uniref:phosphotransferase n=1 Tax=Actinoplanes sp. DH11 TaxID=2857011 RepID=UPI0027DF8A91|nr:phosphotransferase [Actinoplanes sp. DH11]
MLANIRRRWPDVADSWATRVGSEFHAACERYGAIPREVLPARYGFVAAVDTPHGPLVFRSSPDPRGVDQAAVAAALADLDAAPRLHEAVTTEYGTWTVLDRVFPGTSLSQADPATVDPEALFAPLAAIRDQPPPRSDMPSIFEWLRDRLEDDQLTDLRPGTTVAPASERRTALAVLDHLARDHTPALCHGDASSGNIITNGKHWMFIDPRGVTGEHTYDAAVLAIRITEAYSFSGIRQYIAQSAKVDSVRLDAWMAVAQAARV